MAYKIPTQNGHYIINDDKRFTLGVAWTDEEAMWLSEKIKYPKERYKAELSGLDYIYEEDLPDMNNIHRRHLYFAHPGTYRFIPNTTQTSEVKM